MEKRQRYFEEALSDFVHDAASGAAIRHLVDLGYSVEQMMQALSYPTPRERVRQTAYRYMLESGLIVADISFGEASYGAADENNTGCGGSFRTVRLQISDRKRMDQYLYGKIRENGEENVYLSCPFGIWRSQEGRGEQDCGWIRDRLPYLSKREQDYIMGIPWEGREMYHRLNDRMREIGRKLILHMEPGCRYYFIKTRETVEGVL